MSANTEIENLSAELFQFTLVMFTIMKEYISQHISVAPSCVFNTVWTTVA